MREYSQELAIFGQMSKLFGGRSGGLSPPPRKLRKSLAWESALLSVIFTCFQKQQIVTPNTPSSVAIRQ